MHLDATALEEWVLGEIGKMVLGNSDSIDVAVDRFVKRQMKPGKSKTTEIAELRRQIKKIDVEVKVITASIDPENLSMLNDEFTRRRLRKERLEDQLQAAESRQERSDDGEGFREWVRGWIGALARVLKGRRTDAIRRVVMDCIEEIIVSPSEGIGYMTLNAVLSAVAPKTAGVPRAVCEDGDPNGI